MLLNRPRKGIAVLDAVVGLSVLTAALVLVSQTAVWILAERQQTEARYQAVEVAAHVMESARACAWEELDSTWADQARQQALQTLAGRLADPDLSVSVKPAAGRDQVRRVTVELTWQQSGGRRAPPILLTALFARWTNQGKSLGGKP